MLTDRVVHFGDSLTADVVKAVYSIVRSVARAMVSRTPRATRGSRRVVRHNSRNTDDPHLANPLTPHRGS